MYKKAKKAFIPAAIACIGVEHAPGALPCTDDILSTRPCDTSDIKFTNQKPSESKHIKHKNSKSLYERVVGKDILAKYEEPTTNRKNVKATKSENKKQLLTKAKDIELPEIKQKKSKTNKKITSNSSYTYVVNKGDTLAKLALKYNTTIKDLLKINNLKNSDSIKIGQKILIPKNNLQIAKRKIYKNFYVVEKGDTLSKIAKLTGVNVTRLIKYNNLGLGKIKVGQKIYLSANNYKANKTPEKRIVKKPKNTQKVLKPTRQIRVTATAYTSHPGQTDSTPFLAAWNNRIRPGMKIIAVSRDLIKKYGLTNGVKVKLKGLPGYYTVRDKMNKRFTSRIDIYMGLNKNKALKWGKKRVVLMW